MLWGVPSCRSVSQFSATSLILTSRQKSGQCAPPSLTQNRLLQFSRQAQTAQFCRGIILFRFQIKALSSLARLRLLNVPLTLSLSQRERVHFYPLPLGEGGQRPGEGLRRLNPHRLDIILDLKSELLLQFLFRREQVDDFVAANQTEVLAGNAFHVAPVGFECHDITFQLFVVTSRCIQSCFNFSFILPEFM